MGIYLLVFMVGLFSGVVLEELIYDEQSTKQIYIQTKWLRRITGGMYMGCAFLTAPRYIFLGYDMETLVVFFGMFLLAVCAIQDLLENAVYAMILNAGIFGVAMLQIMLYVMRAELIQGIGFLLIGLAVFIILRIVRKLAPDFMGEGDYDILLILFLLSGRGVLQIVFLASFVGVVVYLPRLVFRNIDKTEPIPLAPIMYVGTVLYYLS